MYQKNKILRQKILQIKLFSQTYHDQEKDLFLLKHVSEAYNILKSTVQTNKQKDSSDIFGDYIARKHRKYNVKT